MEKKVQINSGSVDGHMVDSTRTYLPFWFIILKIINFFLAVTLFSFLLPILVPSISFEESELYFIPILLFTLFLYLCIYLWKQQFKKKPLYKITFNENEEIVLELKNVWTSIPTGRHGRQEQVDVIITNLRIILKFSLSSESIWYDELLEDDDYTISIDYKPPQVKVIKVGLFIRPIQYQIFILNPEPVYGLLMRLIDERVNEKTTNN